jgi:hypothetical protein
MHRFNDPALHYSFTALKTSRDEPQGPCVVRVGKDSEFDKFALFDMRLVPGKASWALYR